MITDNLGKQHFDAAEQQQAENLLAQLHSLLRPKLTQLSADQRRTYGSINEDNKQIVNKVYDYQRKQPDLSSPDVDWQEFAADYQSRQFLEAFILQLKAITYELENNKILHDSDNYRAALADYSFTQYKAERNALGAVQKMQELKQFFPRSVSSPTPDEKEESK